MVDYHYVFIVLVCLGQTVRITVSNSRFNQRLTTTENRLDIVTSEISNFRHDIRDIWTHVEQFNTSKCPSSVHSNTHEHTTETIQDVKTIQELTKIIISAFQAEKQIMHHFQITQLWINNNRDNQLQRKTKMNKINIKATTNRLSSLESKTDALSKHSKSTDGQTELEISNLKQQLSDLSTNYENLLEINKQMQHKFEMLEKCQQDWYLYRRSCYYLSSEEVTWNQALEWCWMNNAQLVEYGDMDEVNFVWNMTKTLANWDSYIWTGYWVGASNIERENNFIWSTSKSWVSHSSVSYWLPGQPDHDSEDCMMSLVHKDGHWNDKACASMLKFVCERQLIL